MHGALWNPVLLNLNQFLGAGNHLVNIKVGDAQLSVTRVHSAEVLVDTVHVHAVIYSLVGFGTLKALN